VPLRYLGSGRKYADGIGEGHNSIDKVYNNKLRAAMTIRLHYFQHVPFEGLGSIERWAQNAGCHITVTRFYDEPALPATDAFDWLVVMGGPMGVHDEADFPWLAWEKELIHQAIGQGKVVLGICLGAQLIAEVLGAQVYPNAVPEIGWFAVQKTESADKVSLSRVFPDVFDALHWHGDTFNLPANGVHLARSQACRNQGFVFDERVVGLQFHLETGPEDLNQLITHCRDELDGSAYVQSPAQMLSEDRPFKHNQSIMNGLLNELIRI
jgi:GMP synthase (glutamine-hydrolysing)